MTEAQDRANRKYQEKFVKIQIMVTPDEKQKIKEYADNNNTSIASLIKSLLQEKIL